MTGLDIINAIWKHYNTPLQGITYWGTHHNCHGNDDGKPWTDPIEGLVWEGEAASLYPKPSWTELLTWSALPDNEYTTLAPTPPTMDELNTKITDLQNQLSQVQTMQTASLQATK